MHYKTNRQNHDFQIAYFIAGSCHTYDAAYAILCDLYEDRTNAIKQHEAAKLREEAKRVLANEKVAGKHLGWYTKFFRPAKVEAERLVGEAELAEINAAYDTTQACLNAAYDEVEFIRKAMEKIEPLRKYRDLPLAQAHQAAQAEEWKLELIHRAENFLLTQKHIPADHFSTMRMHPAFKDEIWPEVLKIERLMMDGNIQGLTARITATKKVDLPPLLEQ